MSIKPGLGLTELKDWKTQREICERTFYKRKLTKTI